MALGLRQWLDAGAGGGWHKHPQSSVCRLGKLQDLPLPPRVEAWAGKEEARPVCMSSTGPCALACEGLGEVVEGQGQNAPGALSVFEPPGLWQATLGSWW